MRRFSLAFTAVLAFVAAACDGEEPTTPNESELAALRAATEPFQDVTAAHEAGYEVLVQHPTNGARCLADVQQGGMGFHYLDPTLVDAAVNVESPEVVIYEPRPGGSLELVAVEYIIPYTIRGEDEEPPVLFGREFSRNSTFQLWALHAWAWKENPSGTFANYNPAVTCQYADEVP